MKMALSLGWHIVVACLGVAVRDAAADGGLAVVGLLGGWGLAQHPELLPGVTVE